jgi:hypothetical protein
MPLSRRHVLGFALSLPAISLHAAEDKAVPPAGSVAVRGKLEALDESTAGLRQADGRFVRLQGDEQTEKVLHDQRLQGIDFEVLGERQADGSVKILPIHLAALFTYKQGQRLRVTYYCDVCAIRTYSPGMCMCCREDTRVDLVDPEAITRAAEGAGA